MSITPIAARFAHTFGDAPDVVVRSPGRVNLIGDHTDYNDGFVLPAALDLGTTVAARGTGDGILRVVAPRLDGDDRAPLADLRPREGPEWTRYVRGAADLLQRAGCDPGGAQLLIDGDLPIGAGLSSSASLEIGVALALLTLAGSTIDRRDLALLGRRVENEIVGVNSGVMDQLAVACGREGHALLIDCRSLDVEPVPLPDDVRILVLDTAAPRTLSGSAYNERRGQCEAALRRLRSAAPDIVALREVTAQMLASEARRLPAAELHRARHVVSENERVLAAAAALRRGDVEAFGRLMVASHASLRDDYAVSCPELDAIVDIALDTAGVLGARLTGAGFGGCAVALVVDAQADAAAHSIARRYRDATGLAGRSFICAPGDAAHVLARGTAPAGPAGGAAVARPDGAVEARP